MAPKFYCPDCGRIHNCKDVCPSCGSGQVLRRECIHPDTDGADKVAEPTLSEECRAVALTVDSPDVAALLRRAASTIENTALTIKGFAESVDRAAKSLATFYESYERNVNNECR